MADTDGEVSVSPVSLLSCNKTYCTVVGTDGGCQCRLFLYKADAECNKTCCTLVDTDGGVSVSSALL